MGDGAPRIREMARAEFARQGKLAETAAAMLAPLAELVEDLRDIDVEARLEIADPRSGTDRVEAMLYLPRIHPLGDGKPDWSADELDTVAYEVTVNTREGTVGIEDAVPTPDEDPEAYALGARPEPTWGCLLGAGDARLQRTLAGFADEIRALGVEREMGRLGPAP